MTSLKPSLRKSSVLFNSLLSLQSGALANPNAIPEQRIAALQSAEAILGKHPKIGKVLSRHPNHACFLLDGIYLVEYYS